MQEYATWHVCKENDNIYVVPWLLKLMGSKKFSSLLEGTKIKIMKFRATREVNKLLHYFLSCSTYFLYKIKLTAVFLGVPNRCKRCQNMLFCALASEAMLYPKHTRSKQGHLVTQEVRKIYGITPAQSYLITSLYFGAWNTKIISYWAMLNSLKISFVKTKGFYYHNTSTNCFLLL